MGQKQVRWHVRSDGSYPRNRPLLHRAPVEPRYQRCRAAFLVQRFGKTNHMLTDLQLVIPGRLREAEARPESITRVSGYGFRALDPRPSADGLAPE